MSSYCIREPEGPKLCKIISAEESSLPAVPKKTPIQSFEPGLKIGEYRAESFVVAVPKPDDMPLKNFPILCRNHV